MAYDDDDDGLGLQDFLDHDPDQFRGGGGQFLGKWKKAGEIDIWLHTESRIRPVNGHQIPFEIEVDEKNQDGEKTGRKISKLSWPRFVSPDQPNINANQFFRDKATGAMQEIVNKDPKTSKPLIYEDRRPIVITDPFLLFREYLWWAIEKKIIEPDQVVLEWVDHKNKGELISWTAGEVSRQVKRGLKNRGHSFDTKLEYLFVVVDNAKPGEGPKIARETKLLGDKMRAVIKREMESRGEQGDPFQHPYCIRWKFIDKASSPMNSYDAFRMDKHQCTDEIWQAIGGEPAEGDTWEKVEAPETASMTKVNDGDMDKIRQVFETAAQIEVPFDAFFSPDPDVRRSVLMGTIFAGGARVSSSSPRPSGEGRTEGTQVTRPGAAPGGAARPAASTSGPTRPGTSSAAPATSSGPQPRRKKVATEEPAKPKAPPEPERIPCDGPDGGSCDYMLLPTDAKCPKCGTEYEIGPEVVEPDPAPTTTAKPTSSGAQRPSARSAEEQAEVADITERKCIGCGTKGKLRKVEEDGKPVVKCDNCGCDQGDDIPFD